MKNSLTEIVLLTKAGLMDTYSLNSLLQKKAKGGSRRSLIIVLLVALCLVPAVFSLFWQMAGVLEIFNRVDLLIYMSVILVLIITLITTVYKAPAFLFNFKDYDLLSSFPVRNSSILVSKLVQLLINNQLIALFVIAEALIIYAIKCPVDITFIVLSITLTPLLIIVPTLIGSLLAYAVTLVSSRLKKTNIASYVGILLMVAATYWLQYYIMTLTVNTTSPPDYFEKILNFYFIGDFYVKAVIEADAVKTLLYVAVNAAVFAAFTLILNSSFKRINARLTEKAAGKRYKLGSLKSGSLIGALYRKELKFYFANAMYCLNTSIGALMFAVYGVALAIFGKETVAVLVGIPQLSEMLAAFSIAAACLMIGISSSSSVSISVEGKSLWILRSLPVTFKNIAAAKVLLNLTVTLSCFAIGTIGLLFCYSFTPQWLALHIASGVIYALFSAVFGLVINLMLPKLEWKSIIHVVKQSSSALVSVFANMFIVILLIMLHGTLGISTELFIGIVDLFFLAAAIILWTFVCTEGEERFIRL